MMAAVLAAHGETDRKVWGFDSFQGLPPPNEEEYPNDRGDQLHRFPQLAVSLEEVTENFRADGSLERTGQASQRLVQRYGPIRAGREDRSSSA